MNTLLALVVATAVLVTIPGPSMALIVANSLKFGFRSGLVTVMGTTMGLGMQLALVVVGMTAVIELAADTLNWVRWAGAAYLVWLGVKTWRTPAEDFAAVTAVPVIFWRGCLVAAANPKTLMFNVAFIPQFVGAGEVSSLTPTTVAAVYLSVVLFGDILWVVLATSARRALSRYSSWRNRLTGAFLAAAGVGLALSRR